MVDQLVDKHQTFLSGPQGDITPQARDALEATQRARDEAEAFSGSAEALQDTAVAALVGSGSLSAPAVDARITARSGIPHVFSMLSDLQSDEAKALPAGTIAYVTETDRVYSKARLSNSWVRVVSSERRWAGSNTGSSVTVRAIVIGMTGVVSVFNRPTTLAVDQALNTGITVPEEFRPVLSAAVSCAIASGSNKSVTLEVGASDGVIRLYNRGGVALNEDRVFGSVSWMVES